jgi:hypothetical protein
LNDDHFFLFLTHPVTPVPFLLNTLLPLHTRTKLLLLLLLLLQLLLSSNLLLFTLLFIWFRQSFFLILHSSN